MTKEAFLTQLEAALQGLPQREIHNTLAFYREMIDDRTEEGLSEEEAIADLGSIEEIVSQVMAYTPLSKILIEKARPKRKLRAWEIVLLILGSPIWFSLLVAAFAVVFSLYISAWAVIVSLWAVFVSVACAGFGGIAGGGYFGFTGHVLTGLVFLAGGLVCGGLGVFLFYGCQYITSKSVLLSKKLFQGVKALFTFKEVT